MSKTKECTPEIKVGRLTKATQFLAACALIESNIDDNEMADAFITLCVHAGIAASDVICCSKLNVHSYGGNHNNAVGLLAQIDLTSSIHLKTLLDMKGHSGYSAVPSTPEYRANAKIAAEALVQAAQLA